MLSETVALQRREERRRKAEEERRRRAKLLEKQRELRDATLSMPTDAECELFCVVCLEGTKDTVLVPCGHLCACQKCAVTIRARAKCPICRATVERTCRVYYT